MDVGGADVVDQVVHHRAPGAGAQALGPRSDHELGRLLDVGERGHRGSHIVSPQFAVRPAERDEQAALPFEVGAGLPIRARDVDPDQLPARPVREPCGPAHEQLASFAAEGDDDALASRCDIGRVRVEVACDLLVDAVGEPRQSEVTEAAEHRRTEQVRPCGVEALRRVDVPVGEPPAQRLGAHVDQFDLCVRGEEGVRHEPRRFHTGEHGDRAVQRRQVTDVERRDDVDTAGENSIDGFPPWVFVAAPVSELVDEHDPRLPPEDQPDIQFGITVDAGGRRDPFQRNVATLPRWAVVDVQHADHDVGAAVGTTKSLLDHRVRLADAGRRSEVEP